MEDQEREAAIDTEQDDELDLSLGLRPAPIRRNLHTPIPATAAAARDDSSDLSPIWGKGGTRSEQEPDGMKFPELQAKREAQALRRHEARKKRDEKKKSKANPLNERLLWWFEKRRAVGRESDEGDYSERRRKGGNGNSNGADSSQLNALPYLIMPGLVGSDGNGLQPALGAGCAGEFRPYGHGGGGAVSDNLKRSVSSCSRGSSPGVSDYQSASGGQGGSSSDGGSRHSHPLDLTVKNCPTTSNDTQIQTSHHDSQPSAPPNSSNGKADCGASSYQPIEPSQTLKKMPIQTNPPYLDQNSETQTSPGKKPMPTHRIQSPHPVTNEPNLRKPPKPKAQQSNEAVLLPHMPCVATTGNGPNGKRITGFLYKYTKSEVSIVCICHGSSFSPAGFVEHAGGVGIENPLRHITIAPSSFN